MKKLRGVNKITFQELPELAVHALDAVAQFCKDFVDQRKGGTTTMNKKEESEFQEVLASCWGLMAIDPHHKPFAQLLNSALALCTPPTDLLELRGQMENELKIYKDEQPLRRAELLVNDALAGTGPDLALIVEASHLFLLTTEGEARSSDDDGWLQQVLKTDSSSSSSTPTSTTSWSWPEGGLSYRHLLALSRARDELGWAFLGCDLDYLVAKALVAFCWTDEPPIDDDEWCEVCVDLLVVRLCACARDSPLREEILRGLPDSLLTKFYEEDEKSDREAQRLELIALELERKNKANRAKEAIKASQVEAKEAERTVEETKASSAPTTTSSYQPLTADMLRHAMKSQEVRPKEVKKAHTHTHTSTY